MWTAALRLVSRRSVVSSFQGIRKHTKNNYTITLKPGPVLFSLNFFVPIACLTSNPLLAIFHSEWEGEKCIASRASATWILPEPPFSDTILSQSGP